MSLTQREIVINQLNETGKISRNWCLRNYISRLGAIACQLKKEGWSFATQNEGGDYIYYTVRKPKTGETFNAKSELKEITLKQTGMFPAKKHYEY